ncbi:alpha/beta fold hydrolase [Planomicrobium sp. MB-3u-38]|uniref:alpha/beta fold hydrolase n=1 Tax=Planomicrobium sp. MB-3u-38 TaxID=2058318 RepID=UPI000C7E4DDA|nr:alpha/beta hydrolase [Planomicrobium sp. MB-3u-38]PKH12088.1 proline iminopeptidase [Planomicrobium sp. MB-3u-38]
MKWTQKIIKTTRGDFEVFIKGDGPPLCVTHHYSEFNETGDFFADAFMKTNLVFLVNLREAGNSAKAEKPHQLSLLETVLDLEAIREALGFDEWGFAGHSTGGMLGVVYGIYFSEKLSFNVIVGAAAREYMTFSKDCIYNEQHPQFEKMQELMENLKQPGLSAEEKSSLKIQRTKLSLANPDKYDDYFTQDIRKELSAVRLNFFSRELHVFDVTRKLRLITAPTLIICGKHDVQCPLEYSVEMNELIPDSTLAIFEDSNHYPFLEEAERFGEAYQSFVEQL